MIHQNLGESQAINTNPSLEGSVTLWLQAMRMGDQDAVSRLWERYNGRLLRLARKRLQSLRSRAVDEEDVALSAFTRFCRSAERGRLDNLCNRDDLWRLLLKFTLDRAIDIHRRETAQKRGRGMVVARESLDTSAPMADPVDASPTPEMAAILADKFETLMTSLGKEDLQQIAVLRLEGFTTKELAKNFDLSERTIERRLRLIRKTWQEYEAQ